MKIKAAIGALSALAHEGRLSVFRMLVKAGPDGVAAGDIARREEAPAAIAHSRQFSITCPDTAVLMCLTPV